MPIHTDTLPNGLTLLAEPVPNAGSLAMRLLLPGGAAYQPDDREGVAAVLSEMMLRGAGGRSAREHAEALDDLGVQRSTDVTARHLHLSAVMIGKNLPQALPLLLDTVIRPNLDAASLDPSKDLSIQALDGLVDQPQHRAIIALRQRHDPAPFGRCAYGIREHIEALGLDAVAEHHRRCCVPGPGGAEVRGQGSGGRSQAAQTEAFPGAGVDEQLPGAGGAILAFAGALDWPALRDRVGELTESWRGAAPPEPTPTPAPRDVHHLPAESAQVHIAVACPTVPEPDPRSVEQSAAVAVLSGGMSGRLFSEVREKRGLCYDVHASYSARRDDGAVTAYAGTTTPRAQQTLDVLLAELRRLRAGVTREEFDRAVVGMKSRLVMSGESTSARAAAIAADQFNLGRPRTLDELAARVDGVTLDSLNRFIADQPLDGFTIVTIGPEPLAQNEDQP